MSTETKTLTNADAKIQPKLGVKALVQIGMLSAIAIILMMFEIPLPFAPTFYKIDLSEVPVLVGCFAMGPMAGVLVELVKILLNPCYDRNINSRCWRDCKLYYRMFFLCTGRSDL